MKKFRTLAVMAVLALFGNALAAPVFCPGQVPQTMTRYESFARDERGDWTVHDQYAAQLLRRVANGDARNYLQSGYVLLYPSLRGNDSLGLVEPVLNVLLARNAPIGADSLSIAVGGCIYDFVATPESASLGNVRCERFALPLDAEGLALLDALAQGEYSVAIYSDARQVRVDVAQSNSGGRAALEEQSRSALASFCALYRELGLENYPLWDLNEAHWAEQRPRASIRPRAAGREDFALDSFGCVDVSDRDSVAALQRILEDAQFYADKVDGKIGAQTREAIRAAQQFYGLLPTGQADSTLLDALAGNLSAQTGETVLPAITVAGDATDAALGQAYRWAGLAEIQLNRMWIAPQAQTTDSEAEGAQSAIMPENTSNALLIVDGWMTNESQQPISLPRDCAIEFIFPSGHAFRGVLRCEQMQGAAWGTELLPRERARIVGCAEIPASLWNANRAELTLQIATGERSVSLCIP